MSFINHNVNFGLLFLVLMATVTLVTSTVFFQIKYDQIVQEYNSQADIMNQLTNQLQTHQSALTKVNGALKLAQDRETALGQITAKNDAEKNSIRTSNAPVMFKIPVRKNPTGVVVNNAFSARPQRAQTALNGWGTF